MFSYRSIKNHPLTIEYEKKASSIIYALAQRNYSKDSLYLAQIEIIDALLSIHKNIHRCDKRQKSLKIRAARFIAHTKSRESELKDEEKFFLEALHLRAKNYQSDIKILQWWRWLFRYIGDGIAWRAYNFGRRFIGTLGDKESVPFPSTNDGVDSVVAFFEKIWSGVFFPLMHDLTNCLRTGDISVFKENELSEILELKTRKSEISTKDFPNPREYRQKQWLNKATLAFRSGEYQNPRTQQITKLVKLTAFEKYNFGSITKVMSAARQEGYGLESPEEGIVYLAWKAGDDLRINMAVMDEAHKQFPRIFKSLITYRSVSARFEQYHANLPITAMSIPPENILDLIFENIALLIILDLNQLKKQCVGNGIPLQIQRKPLKFVVKTDTEKDIGIEGMIDRVLLEGLSLASFVDIAKGLLEYVNNPNCP